GLDDASVACLCSCACVVPWWFVAFPYHRRDLFSWLSFFFHDSAPSEIYTLSLHDALPISEWAMNEIMSGSATDSQIAGFAVALRDRKSTRLNSSHVSISYAVFCLKKKKKKRKEPDNT